MHFSQFLKYTKKPRITQTRTAAHGDDHQFDDRICLYIDSTHWYWKQNIEPVCSTSIIGDVEPALVVLRCSWFLHVQCVSDFTSYLFFAHDMAQTFTVQYITVATYGVFSWNQVVVLSDLVVAIVSSNNMRGHFRQIDQIRFHIIDDVSPNMLNLSMVGAVLWPFHSVILPRWTTKRSPRLSLHW